MKEAELGLHGASAEIEIFREVEQDDEVINRIAAAQREELEREIASLQAEARARGGGSAGTGGRGAVLKMVVRPRCRPHDKVG